MKIRIRGNTLRYRLLKTDVEQLFEKGFVEESTAFPTQTFSYRIEVSSGDKILADFNQNQVLVSIPQTMAEAWYHTDIISFKESLGDITILLEKDFVCLDHTDEDQSQNYPNPNTHC